MTARKIDLFRPDGSIRTFDEIEQDVLRLTLAHCGGSMTVAARALNLGRSTVYRKLDELHRVLARHGDSVSVKRAQTNQRRTHHEDYRS